MEKQDALAALAALAQETRLDAFRCLVRAGAEGVGAGALAAALAVPPATLSFHLKELRGAGIVQVERDGRERVYRADFAAMRALLAFLTEQCCAGMTPGRVREGRPRARRAHHP
jgi:DNA-binding transcriptional ArsR family regulator